MKCEVCGYTSSTDFQFCKHCGAPAPDENFIDHPNPKTLLSIKSGLFLAICILFTAASVMNPFNIINIICTVVLWLVYANGRNNTINSTYIKILSGCTFATEIIWIITGIIIGLSSAFPSIMGIIALSAGTSEPTPYDFSGISSGDVVTTVIACLALGFLFLIPGIVLIVLSLTTIRPIHKFIKSVYKGVENQVEDVYKPKKARTALIFISIISIITAFLPFIPGLIPIYGWVFVMMYFIPLSFGALAASLVPVALILSSSIIKKHFLS